MSFQQEVKRLVWPLVKSSPIIFGLLFLALLIMGRAIIYMTPTYEANGAIKINNLAYSQSGFLLFGKEEGMQHQQNQNFLTEVEVFQSRDLIRETLAHLNWGLSIYREGRFRLAELGSESPLHVSGQPLSSTAEQEDVIVEYLGGDSLRIHNDRQTVCFGDFITTGNWQLSITRVDSLLAVNPAALRAGDRFYLKWQSLDEQVRQVNGSNLFVKPVEKDVSIIKVYFKHERPEKAQAFVNALLNTYIRAGQKVQENQSDATLRYLDEQLKEVEGKLRTAERELAQFRSFNRLVDPQLETDAQLRQLARLDQQQLQLQLEREELAQLFDYLRAGRNLIDFSPNLESLQDPVFRDAFLKMKQLEMQRQDLLRTYVPASQEVQHTEQQLGDFRTFLNESVRNTLQTIDFELQQIDANLVEGNRELYDLPKKEQRLIQLQRQLSLQEAMYNYLTRKRTEVAINRSANLYPHRIIDHAEYPEGLAAPNKPLLYGLAVLLALMVGALYAYLRSYFTARVRVLPDLENLGRPVLGTVFRLPKKWLPWQRPTGDVNSFTLSHQLLGQLTQLERNGMLMLGSLVPGEGRSFVSRQLAQALASSGRKVLLIDANLRKPSLHTDYDLALSPGLSEVMEGQASHFQATEQANLWVCTAGAANEDTHAGFYQPHWPNTLQTWKAEFDHVIVDTPPLGLYHDILPWYQQADLVLFVLRADYTRRRMLRAVRNQLADLQELPVYLVLNAAKAQRALPGYQHFHSRYQAFNTAGA